MALSLPLFGCQYIHDLHVAVVTDNDPELAAVARLAVDAWGEYGFVNDEAGTQVKIVRVVDLRSEGYNNRLWGHADLENNLIQIDSKVTGEQLQHVLTHEFGHILFHCDHITEKYRQGVMLDSSLRVGWPLVPTQDDYDLICKNAGVCIVIGGAPRPSAY